MAKLSAGQASGRQETAGGAVGGGTRLDYSYGTGRHPFSRALRSFDELCAKTRARSSFPGGGQRVERSMCESLVTLDLIDNLIRKRSLLKRPNGGPDYRLILSSVTDELIPLLPQLLPPEGEYVAFIDYTASRQLKRVDLLHQPSNGVSRLLSMTLGDDNVGVLPQLATTSIHKLLAEMRTYDWSGFSTRYWNIAEQDPAIHYLSAPVGIRQ